MTQLIGGPGTTDNIYGRRDSPRRMPGLDLLRALAILCVMYYHALTLHLLPKSDPVAQIGWMGVDLFFALSGFLIGSQLLRPLTQGQRLGLGVFYARRLFRTLPAYLVVLALYFTVPIFREAPEIQPLWQFLTFTENLFIHVDHGKAFSHVWSLCVEEQFYLVAPLAVWILARRPAASKTLAVCIAILLGGIVLRGADWLHDLAPIYSFAHNYGIVARYWSERIYYPTWTRLDGLLAGFTVALLASFRPGLWQRLMSRGNLMLGSALAGLAVAIYLFRDPTALLPSVIGYPILSFSMGCLVVAGAGPSSLIGRRPIPLAGIVAAISYSLYLTHKAVYHLVRLAAGDSFAGHPILAMLAYGGAALLGGALLYTIVERPFLRLRDRLFLRRTQLAAGALAADQLTL